MPPQTTVADTSGLTIRAWLICTRVIVTHKKDANRAEKPIPLTQFGAFQAHEHEGYHQNRGRPVCDSNQNPFHLISVKDVKNTKKNRI